METFLILSSHINGRELRHSQGNLNFLNNFRDPEDFADILTFVHRFTIKIYLDSVDCVPLWLSIDLFKGIMCLRIFKNNDIFCLPIKVKELSKGPDQIQEDIKSPSHQYVSYLILMWWKTLLWHLWIIYFKTEYFYGTSEAIKATKQVCCILKLVIYGYLTWVCQKTLPPFFKKIAINTLSSLFTLKLS